MGFKNEVDKKKYLHNYYLTHKEKSKESGKKWRETHPEEWKNYYKNWREANPEKVKERAKKYREKNKDRINKERRGKYKMQQSEYHRKIKLMVFMHYCNGIPKCQCPKCNEINIKFLTIDHINGGGTKHRRKLGNCGSAIYKWLIDNGFPEGYQVLCMNCNWGKRMNNGVCPHNDYVIEDEKQ